MLLSYMSFCPKTTKKGHLLKQYQIISQFVTQFYFQLSRVLDQPYDINLQVTSVVSRFCLVPHVYLTEYALDPLITPKSSSQTLYSTLQNVVKVLETRAARIPNFRDKLVSTRKRLIGMEQVKI